MNAAGPSIESVRLSVTQCFAYRGFPSSRLDVFLPLINVRSHHADWAGAVAVVAVDGSVLPYGNY